MRPEHLMARFLHWMSLIILRTLNSDRSLLPGTLQAQLPEKTAPFSDRLFALARLRIRLFFIPSAWPATESVDSSASCPIRPTASSSAFWMPPASNPAMRTKQGSLIFGSPVNDPAAVTRAVTGSLGTARLLVFH